MTASGAPRRPPLRIPFRMQVLYGSRGFYRAFSVVLAAFFLFGPLPARMADHNGYRYLLGPSACSCAALACHLLFPFNPYRSRYGRDRSLYRLDERDAGARRLVQLLGSDGCRRVAASTAVKVAALLTAIMAVPALVFRASLDWEMRSPWLLQGLAGGALFVWILVRVESIRWALTAWWEEERPPEPPPPLEPH